MGEELMILSTFFKQLYVIVKNTLLISLYSKAKKKFIFTELLNLLCVVIVIGVNVLILAASIFLSLSLSGDFDLYFCFLLGIFVIAFFFIAKRLCDFFLTIFKFSSLDEEMDFCKNTDFNRHKILFQLDNDKKNGYVVMVVYGSDNSFINSDSYVIPSAYTKYKNGKIGIAGVGVKFVSYKLIGNEDINNVRVGRIINKRTKDDMLIVASKGDVICTYNGRRLNVLYKNGGKYKNINCNIYGII